MEKHQSPAGSSSCRSEEESGLAVPPGDGLLAAGHDAPAQGLDQVAPEVPVDIVLLVPARLLPSENVALAEVVQVLRDSGCSFRVEADPPSVAVDFAQEAGYVTLAFGYAGTAEVSDG